MDSETEVVLEPETDCRLLARSQVMKLHNTLEDGDYQLHLVLLHGKCAKVYEHVDHGNPKFKSQYCELDAGHAGICAFSLAGGVEEWWRDGH